MSDQIIKNVVGLQIGGNVGPNDSVGMHIVMPTQPGVGVSVNVNNIEIDNKIVEFLKNLPVGNGTYDEVKKIAEETLAEQNNSNKLQKLSDLVNIASGMATIATAIMPIKQLLGL